MNKQGVRRGGAHNENILRMMLRDGGVEDELKEVFPAGTRVGGRGKLLKHDKKRKRKYQPIFRKTIMFSRTGLIHSSKKF